MIPYSFIYSRVSRLFFGNTEKKTTSEKPHHPTEAINNKSRLEPDIPSASKEAPANGGEHTTKSATSPASPTIENARWASLVEECVELFDELDRMRINNNPDPSSVELADHVCSRLAEILDRRGVSLIDGTGPYDKALHRFKTPRSIPAGKSEETDVVVRSPGFRIGTRVLLRARCEPMARST